MRKHADFLYEKVLCELHVFCKACPDETPFYGAEPARFSGLPMVLFACAGHKDVKEFVLGTSLIQITAFPDVSEALAVGRAKRLTVDEQNAIRNEFKLIFTGKPYMEKPTAKDVKGFDHSLEAARAFRPRWEWGKGGSAQKTSEGSKNSPEYRPWVKDRCKKCRRLYQYETTCEKLPIEFNEKDTTGSIHPSEDVCAPLSCAEDQCHVFCTRLLVQEKVKLNLRPWNTIEDLEKARAAAAEKSKPPPPNPWTSDPRFLATQGIKVPNQPLITDSTAQNITSGLPVSSPPNSSNSNTTQLPKRQSIITNPGAPSTNPSIPKSPQNPPKPPTSLNRNAQSTLGPNVTTAQSTSNKGSATSPATQSFRRPNSPTLVSPRSGSAINPTSQPPHPTSPVTTTQQKGALPSNTTSTTQTPKQTSERKQSSTPVPSKPPPPVTKSDTSTLTQGSQKLDATKTTVVPVRTNPLDKKPANSSSGKPPSGSG